MYRSISTCTEIIYIIPTPYNRATLAGLGINCCNVQLPSNEQLRATHWTQSPQGLIIVRTKNKDTHGTTISWRNLEKRPTDQMLKQS